MKISELEELQHPFLKNLAQPHLRSLAEFAMAKTFHPGEVIFREGDSANRFYLIRSGAVRLQTHSAGEPILLQKLGAGEVLGWSWLFSPHCWHFDAVAEQETEAIFFYATPLREECEENAAFGYALMKRIAGVVVHRLQGTRQQLVNALKAKRKPCACGPDCACATSPEESRACLCGPECQCGEPEPENAALVRA